MISETIGKEQEGQWAPSINYRSLQIPDSFTKIKHNTKHDYSQARQVECRPIVWEILKQSKYLEISAETILGCVILAEPDCSVLECT